MKKIFVFVSLASLVFKASAPIGRFPPSFRDASLAVISGI